MSSNLKSNKPHGAVLRVWRQRDNRRGYFHHDPLTPDRLQIVDDRASASVFDHDSAMRWAVHIETARPGVRVSVYDNQRGVVLRDSYAMHRAAKREKEKGEL